MTREANISLEEGAMEKQIGHRIRHLRQERGVTLDQLASQTNLTKGQLSKFENGRSLLRFLQ